MKSKVLINAMIVRLLEKLFIFLVAFFMPYWKYNVYKIIIYDLYYKLIFIIIFFNFLLVSIMFILTLFLLYNIRRTWKKIRV